MKLTLRKHQTTSQTAKVKTANVTATEVTSQWPLAAQSACADAFVLCEYLHIESSEIATHSVHEGGQRGQRPLRRDFSRRQWRRRLLIAAALFCSAPAFAQTKPNYNSRENRYAVWFPAKPQSGSRAVSLNGKAQQAKFTYAKSGALTFVVIPMTLPARIPDNKRGEFLNGVQRGFVQSLGNKGRVQSSRALIYRGFMARELIASVGPNTMQARFIVAPRRSYQLLALGPVNAMRAQKTLIAKVMQSLQIKP